MEIIHMFSEKQTNVGKKYNKTKQQKKTFVIEEVIFCIKPPL